MVRRAVRTAFSGPSVFLVCASVAAPFSKPRTRVFQRGTTSSKGIFTGHIFQKSDKLLHVPRFALSSCYVSLFFLYECYTFPLLVQFASSSCDISRVCPPLVLYFTCLPPPRVIFPLGLVRGHNTRSLFFLGHNTSSGQKQGQNTKLLQHKALDANCRGTKHVWRRTPQFAASRAEAENYCWRTELSPWFLQGLQA